MNKNEQQYFLVTTSDELSWPSVNEPVLFLGEWCKRYSRKQVWEKYESLVLPYHWDDRKKLFSDYLYISELYERLLIDLSAQLNRLHGVQHEIRYWRILLGPWLGYFTQMLFDRWFSINQAISGYDIKNTIILKGNERQYVPNDMSDFNGLFFTQEWNHYIYSRVIAGYTNIAHTEKLRPETQLATIRRKGLNQEVKERAQRLYNKFLSRIAKQKHGSFFFVSTYLSRRKELKLLSRLNELPHIWRIPDIHTFEFNALMRQWSIGDKAATGFEAFVRELIPEQIPKAYVEGFTALREQTPNEWPRHPKLIWTSNSYCSEDVFKVWAAEKVEEGSSLVIGQHGGHYGMGLWSFIEDHEIAISDKYFSWGWSDETKQKVKPIGQLKDKKPLKISHAAQPGLLLVTNIAPRQSYHMFSTTVARQWLDYLNDQFRFVEALPAKLREALTVRLHPLDWDWDHKARWNDRFPQLNIDNGRTDITELISKSRIYVSTYNATTYLETFSMDMPTVIYWNPEHWELRDTAIPYFNELQRVGIFHSTPESAALHIAAVWDNVEAWWNSTDVRSVLREFKKNFCDTPDDLLAKIEQALKEEIKEKENVR